MSGTAQMQADGQPSLFVLGAVGVPLVGTFKPRVSGTAGAKTAPIVKVARWVS